MSHIDERIVKMTFDNQGFEKGILKTTEQLEKLNQVLKNTGNADAVNGLSKSIREIKTQLSGLNLDNLMNITSKTSIWEKIGNVLSSAGNGVSTIAKGLSSVFAKLNIGDYIGKIMPSFSKATESSNGLYKSVETVSNGFSALGVVGVTALANITNSAVETGKRLLSSFTLDPITTGFAEYETKMNAISTILANTADEGATLEDVNKALNELNVYADDTIYNFAQMTENIGRFTAAGVNLEDSVAAIKGLSNIAAFFGVDATRASGAMYQMSQALAAGKVQLMDWRSLVNAGMGGEALKEAFVRTSEVIGTGADEMIKKYGSFEESLTKGEWLTGEVLIETLKQISGAYKESELRAQGYSATQAKAIVDMAKMATKSATEVRTVTGMLDAMKESVQSGWAISWEHILGDKEQATELLTGVKDAFEALIEPATTARNKMLEFWNQNGGRDATIKGLSNLFQGLGKVMGSVGDAWKDVFPSMTGEKLVELSNKFKDFTEKLKVSDETAGKIKDTFKGVFDVFKTIGSAVGSAFKAFSPLTAIFPAMGNAILSATSAIGKFGSSLSDALEKSNVFDKIATGIKGAFEGIGKVFSDVSNGFSKFFSYIGNLNFSKAFDTIGKGFKGVGEMLEPITSGLGKAIGTINFDTIMSAMRTGTFLKVLKTLKDTFEEVGGVAESAKGVFSSLKGIGKGIKDTLVQAKEALEAWQNDLQAKTLLKIAGAIAILAGALILISTIDGKSLAVSLGGITVLMAELAAVSIALSKNEGFKGFLTGGGSNLISLATSLLLLASALKILSGISIGEMVTGLVGLAAVMVVMNASIKIMSKSGTGMASTAKSLIVFGAALMVMAGALKLLGSIDSESMGAGLFSLFVVLSELALFLRVAKFDAMSRTTGTSMLLLATSLVVLAGALKILGGMKAEDSFKGLVTLAGALAEIMLFSELIRDTELVKLASSLSAMSVAIGLLSVAMRAMGSMDWDTITKGLVSIGSSLAIFAIAAKSMQELEVASLAVGLGLMGASMLIVGAAISKLGNLSMEQLATGLLGMASALLIIGVAMAGISGVDAMVDAAALVVMAGALAILTPQLVALAQLEINQVGVALVALAGALLLIGIAGAVITPALPGLLGLSGAIALLGVGCLAAGAGLSLFATGFALVGAVIGGSGFIIIEFIRQLSGLLPQLGLKMGEAMVNFANAITNGAPAIIGAFTTLFTAMMTAINTNIPLMVQTAVDFVVAFAQGLAEGVPELVRAGYEMVLGVLQGIADNIGPIIEAGADICVNFMDGVAAELPRVIDSGINLSISFINGVADGLINHQAELEAAISRVIEALLTTGLSVIEGGIDGFIKGGTELINGLIDGICDMFPGAEQAVRDAVDAAKKGAANAGTALVQAGSDMISGMIKGLTSGAQWLYNKASEIATNAANAAKKALGINSPSKVFMEIGKYVNEGFVKGMDKNASDTIKSASGLANSIIDTVKNPLSNIAKLIDGNIDVNPTITPVLDLSNVERNSRRLGDLVSANGTLSLTTNKAVALSGSMGQIQNGNDNSDIISALKDLKDNLNNNGPSYTINGITYDDGSNVVNAVEALVRAAKIERRI